VASGLFYHDAIAALTAAGVPFVVVGGVAVNLQGVPRFTADLDVALALDGAVLVRAARALAGLGLRPRLPVTEAELGDTTIVRGWVEERNLTALTLVDAAEPLREVDLVVASPVPFEELLRTADRMTAAGLTFPVASVEALIRMKENTGRAQDDSDVDALRRVRGATSGP
jgi:hypothetical protein